jgi:hypothetical protein
VRRQLQRRLDAVATRRRERPRGFVRSIRVIHPDVEGIHQDRWLELAEDRVLAELRREPGQRLLLSLYVAAENRVHVDAGPWRYLVGIDEAGAEPVATILAREERRW